MLCISHIFNINGFQIRSTCNKSHFKRDLLKKSQSDFSIVHPMHDSYVCNRLFVSCVCIVIWFVCARAMGLMHVWQFTVICRTCIMTGFSPIHAHLAMKYGTEIA